MTGSRERPFCLCHRHDAVELADESELVPEQGHPPFEGQGGERHPPSLALGADDVGAVGAGPVEEDLVELTRLGQLHDGAHLDAGLVHGDQQVGEPLVALRLGIGAADDEAPVGLVRQRGPHLLAGDDPLVAVAARRGS